jgi:osmotically-inducible protein OsmY
MPFRPLFLTLLLIPLVQGCATAVIGGGGTAVAVAHDRRSTGTVVEDQENSIKVFNYIQKNEELKKFSDISSTGFNRKLLLTGAAATPAIAAKVAHYAKGLPGVAAVINEIEIHPEYNGSVQGTVNDAYINTQVKLRMFKVKLADFDPTRVNVTTYNGSVYLMGLVTEAEGSAAAEEARYVSDVKRVVKHFEYIALNKPDSGATSARPSNLDEIH